MPKLDPRINAFRADLAAMALKGTVEAPRFAEGKTAIVASGTAPLRKSPEAHAGMETQLLYGERFVVFNVKNGWAWGQAALDNYVGYVEANALRAASLEPTHRVAALATPLLPLPDVKRAARDLLPMNTKLRILAEENRFAKIDNGAFVYAAHLVSLSEKCSDWVSVAERFLGAPYLWGGKTIAGCDCSGLIQSALEAGGIIAPRDTDMMKNSLGVALAVSETLDALQRGDLVFWKGHMGVMLDPARLLHANVFHMQVAVEPLHEAAARIAQSDGPILSINRMV